MICSSSTLQITWKVDACTMHTASFYTDLANNLASDATSYSVDMACLKGEV